ncbi:hypothetical protein [Trichloromonas sp.]|uniref:hypothetical protein n=1 Tax=Trichloromonas sp. TaxID=3069249 RepID=UPI003D814157
MSRTIGYVVSCLLLWLLVGCSPQHKIRVLWPAPPEQPRLEWLGLFSTRADFNLGGKKKAFTSFLTGDEELVFGAPGGVAADARNRVFVSDLQERTVHVLDFDNQSISRLKNFQFGRPVGLAVGGDGRVYVADAEKRAIVVFSPQLNPVLTMGDASNLERPAYVAVNDRLGRIYVSDGKNHKIVVFDLAGKHLFSFGGLGNAPGALHAPQGLAFDSKGRLYVADMMNARVQVFNDAGGFLFGFGERGDLQWQFENPKGLAFDHEDHLYVTDARKGAMFICDVEGNVLLITGAGKRTHHPLGYSVPNAVAVSPDDRIYITDLLNRRVTVWQYLNADYLSRHPVTEAEAEELLRLQEQKP